MSADKSRPAQPEQPAGGLSVRVLSGSPTPEELAAVIAVVSEAYSGEAKRAVTEDKGPTSAWARSAHAMRQRPAQGSVWGRFEG